MSKLFRGHGNKGAIELKDSDLEMTGLMNPNGRKGSFVAVLMVLQWIQPFMLLVSRGGNALLEALRKCYAVRGINDFRVNKILDSTLQVLALSSENEEPNVILEQILQLTSETEEGGAAVTSLFGGKRCIRTRLSSSLTEEVTFANDEPETSNPALMIKLTIPRSDSHSLRDVLNENLKRGESLPFSRWKEDWKAQYSTQGIDVSSAESDLCATSYERWIDCPTCLILALNRAGKKRNWDSTSVSLDVSVPLADILRPEDDTLHSSTDPSIPSGTYQLFALIVKSEEERFYTCIKSGGQASDKWTVYDGLQVKDFSMTDELLETLSGGVNCDFYVTAFYVNSQSWHTVKQPSVPERPKETLLSVGEEDDCIIIRDKVQHEAVLHKMEKSMNTFVGLKNLKEQFLRFTRTQLQNDRRKHLGQAIAEDTPLHLVFAGNPGTGKTTFARRVADLLFSIKKIKKNKIVEVQRSDLIGQYLGSSTEKTKAKILEARGGVLFIDEAYRLIPAAGGKDFGREAIEELMSVMEDGDPVMIFAGYKDKMEKFLDVNPGLRSRIYRNFVFADYSTEELEEIFHLKAAKKGFRVDANVGELLTRQTSERQRSKMNARLVRILLHESIEEASNRLPLDAPLSQLMELKASDIEAACTRLPPLPQSDPNAT